MVILTAKWTTRPLLFAALLNLVIGGCDAPPRETTVRPPETGFIAFVGAGNDDPLWPLLRGGAERHRPFSTFEIRFFAPEINSIRQQIELLESLPDQGLRGLCIQASDAGTDESQTGLPAALQPVLERFNRRGIPLVTMLTALPGSIAAGHVGYDDLEIGGLLAEATARSVDGPATIMVLHAGHGHSAYGLRLAAFEREIAYHHNIEVFARIDSGLDRSTARRQLRERSERFPRLSAWVLMGHVSIRDLMPLDEHLPPGCKLITFDGGPDHWPLIRSDRSPAAVTADYQEAGAKAVQFCEIALREGSRFVTHHRLPLRVIDATDLDGHMRAWGGSVASGN